MSEIENPWVGEHRASPGPEFGPHGGGHICTNPLNCPGMMSRGFDYPPLEHPLYGTPDYHPIQAPHWIDDIFSNPKIAGTIAVVFLVGLVGLALYGLSKKR